jgi:hypothetical protein
MIWKAAQTVKFMSGPPSNTIQNMQDCQEKQAHAATREEGRVGNFFRPFPMTVSSSMGVTAMSVLGLGLTS